MNYKLEHLKKKNNQSFLILKRVNFILFIKKFYWLINFWIYSINDIKNIISKLLLDLKYDNQNFYLIFKVE